MDIINVRCSETVEDWYDDFMFFHDLTDFIKKPTPELYSEILYKLSCYKGAKDPVGKIIILYFISRLLLNYEDC